MQTQKPTQVPFNNPLNGKEQDPGFWLRFLVYFTLSLMWVVSIAGTIFVSVLVKVGSRHSYLGDKVDEGPWIFFIACVVVYTLVASFYLGVRGFSAKYRIILLFNIVLVAAFGIASIIQDIIIFYLP